MRSAPRSGRGLPSGSRCIDGRGRAARFFHDLERANDRRPFHDDQQRRNEIGFPGGWSRFPLQSHGPFIRVGRRPLPETTNPAHRSRRIASWPPAGRRTGRIGAPGQGRPIRGGSASRSGRRRCGRAGSLTAVGATIDVPLVEVRLPDRVIGHLVADEQCRHRCLL